MSNTIDINLSDGRIKWVDVAKAFAMIFVMIEHLNFQIVRPYITVFFMPVFFFLSGITFRADISFRKFIKKKFNSLIIPYIFFSILTLTVFVVYAIFRLPQAFNLKLLAGLFYGRAAFFKNPSESDLIMRGNQQMWFLLALFVAELLMYIGIIFLKSRKIKRAQYIYIYIYI